jgi:hypothetical protein
MMKKKSAKKGSSKDEFDKLLERCLETLTNPHGDGLLDVQQYKPQVVIRIRDGLTRLHRDKEYRGVRSVMSESDKDYRPTEALIAWNKKVKNAAIEDIWENPIKYLATGAGKATAYLSLNTWQDGVGIRSVIRLRVASAIGTMRNAVQNALHNAEENGLADDELGWLRKLVDDANAWELTQEETARAKRVYKTVRAPLEIAALERIAERKIADEERDNAIGDE